MLNIAEMNLKQELRIQANGSAELQSLLSLEFEGNWIIFYCLRNNEKEER